MNPLSGGNNLLGGDRSSNIATGNQYSGGMACTGGGGNSGDGSAGNGCGPLTMLNSYPAQSNCCRIQIVAPIGMTHGYLSKLFNLIPGMDYCDLNEMTGGFILCGWIHYSTGCQYIIALDVNTL